MKAKELIALLQNLDPNTELVSIDQELVLQPVLGIEKLPIVTIRNSPIAALIIGDPIKPNPSDDARAQAA